MRFLKIIIFAIFYLFSLNCSAENLNNNLVNKISKNIRCIVCQGQSVYDSQSDFAISLKLLIKKKLKSGYTEEQIYEYLRNQYGEWIVYEPKFTKNTFFFVVITYFSIFCRRFYNF